MKTRVRPVVAGAYTNRAYAGHGNPGALGLADANDSDAARAVVKTAEE